MLGIKRSKPPLVDELAFPPMGFAVACFGCSLQKFLLFMLTESEQSVHVIKVLVHFK